MKLLIILFSEQNETRSCSIVSCSFLVFPPSYFFKRVSKGPEGVSNQHSCHWFWQKHSDCRGWVEVERGTGEINDDDKNKEWKKKKTLECMLDESGKFICFVYYDSLSTWKGTRQIRCSSKDLLRELLHLQTMKQNSYCFNDLTLEHYGLFGLRYCSAILG